MCPCCSSVGIKRPAPTATRKLRELFLANQMGQVVVITGTDTSAGKTLLTALLLCHLRNVGCRALAMKPFATGDTADADLLDCLQNGELPRTLLNPFFFKTPLAPIVAARAEGKTVRLTDLAAKVEQAAAKCDLLLVEGCGGLLAPLAENFDLLDLIRAVPMRIILTARNRLGVLNHVLLTQRVLLSVGFEPMAIVLMGVGRPDISAETNAAILRETDPAKLVLEIPYLGRTASRPAVIRRAAIRLRDQLSLLNSHISQPGGAGTKVA